MAHVCDPRRAVPALENKAIAVKNSKHRSWRVGELAQGANGAFSARPRRGSGDLGDMVTAARSFGCAN